MQNGDRSGLGFHRCGRVEADNERRVGIERVERTGLGVVASFVWSQVVCGAHDGNALQSGAQEQCVERSAAQPGLQWSRRANEQLGPMHVKNVIATKQRRAPGEESHGHRSGCALDHLVDIPRGAVGRTERLQHGDTCGANFRHSNTPHGPVKTTGGELRICRFSVACKL